MIHQNLALYAASPERSKGRLYQEDSSFRNEFQRDLSRITHSAAFRRLEYKTQVFVNDKGDHYRTRLTHSLEVAQISRVIASELSLSTELAECLGLSHDIGHPPFGHAGEEMLNKMLQEHGGFDHNEYTIKLLTQLEERYINFNGLNLTWETIDGIIKHNGPLIGNYSHHNKTSEFIIKYAKQHALPLEKFPSLEAQVASIADDIAYNSHDLEDGLRAGLFSLNDLYDHNLISDIISEVRSIQQETEEQRLVHEVIRRLINQMVLDVIICSKHNLQQMNITNLDDEHNASKKVIDFSSSMQHTIDKLKKYLLDHMYKHYSVNRMTYKAKIIIKDLYQIFIKHPNCLPKKWQNKIARDQSNLAITIGDYIAGMTDRFATKEHKTLCNF